jgi:hypothetical protein
MGIADAYDATRTASSGSSGAGVTSAQTAGRSAPDFTIAQSTSGTRMISLRLITPPYWNNSRGFALSVWKLELTISRLTIAMGLNARKGFVQVFADFSVADATSSSQRQVTTSPY